MTEGLVVFGVRTPVANPREALSELQSMARAHGGWGQLLAGDAVLGRDHLRSAHEHAIRAFDQGLNTAGSLEMEFLLYASGERQISKAIAAAGARPGRSLVVAITGGLRVEEVLSAFRWERDDSVLEPTRARLRAAGFSDTEVKSAGDRAFDLILERVARVDLDR